MAQYPLTPRLSAKIKALFPSQDHAFAEQWLVAECGDSVPFGAMGMKGLERIRAAALKVSRGSLERLAAATSRAQISWRDLLVSADFAEDVHAHEAWLESGTSLS